MLDRSFSTGNEVQKKPEVKYSAHKGTEAVRRPFEWSEWAGTRRRKDLRLRAERLLKLLWL